MNNLTYLTSDSFSSIPHELVPDLQKMLSTNEALRPSALDFTGKALSYPLVYVFISIEGLFGKG